MVVEQTRTLTMTQKCYQQVADHVLGCPPASLALHVEVNPAMLAGSALRATGDAATAAHAHAQLADAAKHLLPVQARRM